MSDRFDEQGYLNRYSDVAAAVSKGRLSSGWQHYRDFGRAEGRIGYVGNPMASVAYPDPDPLSEGKFQGNVDAVSTKAIQGWAADECRPDKAVDVSIFVDEELVAQVRCDIQRQDLRSTGLHGTGNHGFAFQPTVPIKDGAVITVRFTSGINLPPGPFIMCEERGVVKSAESDELSDNEPKILPVPMNPRDVFHLLTLYREKHDLYHLLSRIPFLKESSREIHFKVFGEVSDALPTLTTEGVYYPRDDFYRWLTSEEYQRRIIATCLRAYLEKRRLIFVHVPKCAGTDFTSHLKQRYPSLDRDLTDRSWTPLPEMLRRICRVAIHLQIYDSIFVSGHMRLSYYTSEQLIRPNMDRVFTITRDPIDLIISQVNYMLTRISADISVGEPGPDTRGWLKMLNMELPTEPMTPALAFELGRAILYKEDIVSPNPMCDWIGHGTSTSALEMLIANDVEVSDTYHYNEWLRHEWGIVSTTRMNQSHNFFQYAALHQTDSDYIRKIVEEDVKLYSIIKSALSTNDRQSVKGIDLLRASKL